MKSNNPSYIPHELASATKNGYVTSTELVKDYILSKSLEELNQLFTLKLNTLSSLVNISINGETFDIATVGESITEGNSALTTANAVAEYLKLFVLQTELADFRTLVLLYISNIPSHSLDLSSYVTLTQMTNSLNELELQLNDYYKKIDTYSKSQIDEKLLLFQTISILIVDEKPLQGDPNILYLIPSLDNEDIYLLWFYQDGEYILLENKTIDLNGYITQLELPNIIQNAILSKQNILISGVNIKSINNISLLGEGNINLVDGIYHSRYDNNSLQTTSTLGNLLPGTILSTLNNRPISEILDMVLFSESWPSNLHHTISYTNIVHLVEENSNVILPTVNTIWNPQVTPQNLEITTKVELINPSGTTITPDSNPLIYNDSGNWIWKLYYKYPESSYIQTSNLGNTRTVIIPGINDYLLYGSETIKVTRPIEIGQKNSDVYEKLTLYPINTLFVITKNLGGSPKIKIPWLSSLVKIEVDLGFGYMDVNGWTRENKNGYFTIEKNDSYTTPTIPHRITVTLIKD